MTSRQDDWAGRLRRGPKGQPVARPPAGRTAGPPGAAPGMIDHSVKPEATPEMIDQPRREHGFAAVCVNPCYVARCARSEAPGAVCSVASR